MPARQITKLTAALCLLLFLLLIFCPPPQVTKLTATCVSLFLSPPAPPPQITKLTATLKRLDPKDSTRIELTDQLLNK